MKKYILYTILFAVVTSCGKKRNDPLSPPPSTPMYTISASSIANGTVSPQVALVVSGKDLILTFTPNDGFRTDSLWIDKEAAVELNGAHTYTVPNVVANHTIKVSFTDALTTNDLDSLNIIRVGKWHTVLINYKPTGNVFTDWYNYPIPPCEVDDYAIYTSDFSYASYENGTFCPGDTTEIGDSGIWNFSANGKKLYLTRPSGIKDSVAVIKMTADSSITIYSASNHYDYKYYDVH